MSRQHPEWCLPIKIGLGTIAALSGLYTFFTAGPAIETAFFPVLSKMEIIDVQPLTRRSSAVTTRFKKMRDCEYMGIAWYSGSQAGAFERVSMVPIRDPDDTSAPSRPTGVQQAGPWRITIPAEHVRDRSFVQVFHRCSPLWVTMSKFYP